MHSGIDGHLEALCQGLRAEVEKWEHIMSHKLASMFAKDDYRQSDRGTVYRDPATPHFIEFLALFLRLCFISAG